MAPLVLVTNLATRWHFLQIWPPDGASCTCCKFGYQRAPLVLVTNLATRWRFLQIWPPDGTSCKFGHQMARLVLVANLATRCHRLNWESQNHINEFSITRQTNMRYQDQLRIGVQIEDKIVAAIWPHPLPMLQ